MTIEEVYRARSNLKSAITRVFFCFVEQVLEPGEEVKMPVVFYIDPSIDDDNNLKNLNEITLSYTFFKKSNKEAKNNKNSFQMSGFL